MACRLTLPVTNLHPSIMWFCHAFAFFISLFRACPHPFYCRESCLMICPKTWNIFLLYLNFRTYTRPCPQADLFLQGIMPLDMSQNMKDFPSLLIIIVYIIYIPAKFTSFSIGNGLPSFMTDKVTLSPPFYIDFKSTVKVKECEEHRSRKLRYLQNSLPPQ